MFTPAFQLVIQCYQYGERNDSSLYQAADETLHRLIDEFNVIFRLVNSECFDMAHRNIEWDAMG